MGSWQRAKELYASGMKQRAIQECVEIIEHTPGNVDALNMLGVIAQESGELIKALSWFDRGLALESDNIKLLSNKAIVLVGLGRWKDVVSVCKVIFALDENVPEAWNNQGIAFRQIGQLDKALESFDKSLFLCSDNPMAKVNRGYILRELKRFDEAILAFDDVLQKCPGLAEIWSTRGNTLRDLGRMDEALVSYDNAISLAPDSADLWFNKGNLFHGIGQVEKALKCYDQAMKLDPLHKRASSLQMHFSQKIARWENLHQACEREINFLKKETSETEPFSLIAMPGVNREYLLQAARQYVRKKAPTKPMNALSPGYKESKRLRVAYVSADYYMHATAVLMAGVFEMHDRVNFEIYAICLGAPGEDIMRTRLKRAFDKFIEVKGLTDEAIAKIIKEQAIDIVVDLKGHTEDSRFGIFLHRVAPIQVTYLGYPGTTGSDCIDYIIGDKWVTPFEHSSEYSEKIVQMPSCYQCNDAGRPIEKFWPSRGEMGLPENGFVFCSFNNTYKINPEVFDIWMRILKAVPQSVLWLLQDNLSAVHNLRAEAELRGVSSSRLIFAPRIPHSQHLARHRNADLFLDTWPCNAHTTASDALRAELPVLTLLGDTFAGRVASSLLNAVGLTELSVKDAREYERLAVELANHPLKIQAYKRKLKETLSEADLFNTRKFTRDLEKAYYKMWGMYRAGEGAKEFRVM